MCISPKNTVKAVHDLLLKMPPQEIGIPIGKPREKIPNQAEFRAMLRRHFRGSSELTEKLVNQEVDAREWGELFDKLLLDAHSESWALGRQRAGDLSAENFMDFLAGLTIKDGEADYLLAFIDDIERGRYSDADGALKPGPINARANLYIKKARGTANESFVASGPQNAQYDWILGLNELHCPDCPFMAASSPWTVNTLFGFPGDGSTRCLGNCLCHLVRDDGRTGFKPVS